MALESPVFTSNPSIFNDTGKFLAISPTVFNTKSTPYLVFTVAVLAKSTAFSAKLIAS